MAFTVSLYAFTKAPNSTAQPTGSGTEYSCVSNDNFNIIQPRIPLQIGAAANPTSYNYAKISAWNRYYWIRSWAWEDGLWVAYMEVDALASWKSGIGGLNAYVLRSAAAWNGEIVDNFYPTASPVIGYQTLSKPWSVSGYSDGFYVVGIISKTATTVYYFMSTATYAQLVDAMFSDSFFNTVKTDDADLTKATFNPIQYVTSVKWFPGTFSGGSLSTIYLGYWDTGISAYKNVVPYAIWSDNYSANRHPQSNTRGQFLNGGPFSEYVLDIPPFGRIAIDPAYLTVSGSFTITIITDYISGKGLCRIYCGQGLLINPAHVILVEASIGVDIQINQVLYNPVGLLSSVVGTVLNGFTGQFGAAMSGIESSAKNNYPVVNTTGINAGFSSLIGSWILTTKFFEVVNDDLTNRGRPLCEVRQLSTLAGYQLCADVEVTLSCTREEEQMIKSALETGYFYE